MARRQADQSSLMEGAEALFRGHGLSFSAGMGALLRDWEKTPSKETQEAIDELEAGKGIRFETMGAFQRWLDEGD